MERKSKEERVKEIAEATLGIITTQGLSQFTTKKLSLAVGLAEGTIFRHFSNKDQIISASVDRLKEILFEKKPELHSDPIKRVQEIFMHRMALEKKFPGYLNLIFSSELAKSANSEISDKINEIRKISHMMILSCFNEAKEKNLIKKEVDPEILIVIFQGTVQAVLAGERSVGKRTVSAPDAEKIWKNLELLIRK